MLSHRSPVLPLRLVEEHLDCLEGLLERRRVLGYSKRPVHDEEVALDRRIAAHVRGLELRRDEALREATLRMASALAAESSAALWVALMLDPTATPGDALRDPLVAAGVLARLPGAVVSRLEPDRVEIALAQGSERTVETGTLESWLNSERSGVRKAALLLFAMQPAPRLMGLVAERALGGAAPAERPFAIVAMACALRERAEDAAAAAFLDRLLGDACWVDRQCALAACLLGHASTARRLLDTGTPLDLRTRAFGLGLLGMPMSVGWLVEQIEGPGSDPAIRALHTITGHWFVRGEQEMMRDDGRELRPDADAARRWIDEYAGPSNERLHLGLPLRGEPSPSSPPSYRALRALLEPRPSRSPMVFPDGVLSPSRREVGLWELAAPRPS